MPRGARKARTLTRNRGRSSASSRSSTPPRSRRCPTSPAARPPLEPPHEPIAGDGLADRVPALVEFADSLELEVAIEKIPGAASGYHEPATGRIVVEDVGPSFSANAQVSVLVHELAHALVRLDRREDDPKLDYAAEEVVVESVAFSVCASLGLDSSGSAVPYVAGWAERSEGDPIEDYAELIDRLARRPEDLVLGVGGGGGTGS